MSVKTLSEIYDYALTFYNKPYIWGGEGPEGYDCSGFVQKLLEKAGLDPEGDQTADTLYKYFLKNGSLNYFGLGSLAFYGSSERIIHVGFCIDTRTMISASGGGRSCTTVQIARAQGASIKFEPIRFRKDFIACIMPPYYLPQGL